MTRTRAVTRAREINDRVLAIWKAKSKLVEEGRDVAPLSEAGLELRGRFVVLNAEEDKLRRQGAKLHAGLVDEIEQLEDAVGLLERTL